MRNDLTYLSSPCNSDIPAEMEYRYEQACKAAAYLMRKGHRVVSPVSHAYGIAWKLDNPRDDSRWQTLNLALLRLCSHVVVARIEGWDTSEQVAFEIDAAKQLGLSITYIDPDEFDPLPERIQSPVVYYGGKARMRSLLAELIPDGGEPYCEPFCGGLWVLLSRKPAPAEVVNDINEDLINMYRVMQAPETFWRLQQMLDNTMYSRAELLRAGRLLDDPDPVVRAWACMMRCNLVHCAIQRKGAVSWGRDRKSHIAICRYLSHRLICPTVHRRLALVQIDCVDALECIRYWDGPDAVFYCDPPYHPDTLRERPYVASSEGDFHHQLVETLLSVKGSVVLSCYDHPVYKPLLDAGWERLHKETVCSTVYAKGKASRPRRVETIYRNPKAVMLKPRSPELALCDKEE